MSPNGRAALLLVSLIVAACAAPPETPDVPPPKPIGPRGPAPAARPDLLFQDITAWSGVLEAGQDAGPGVSAADLDDDGDDDLILPSGPGLDVWLNWGDGSFERKDAIDVDGGYVGCVAELTGDRPLDVLVVNGAGRLRLFEGAGDGTFTPSSRLPELPITGTASGVTFGDFNYTGRLSLFYGRMVPICSPEGRLADGTPCTPGATPDKLPPVVPTFFRHAESGFVDDTVAAGLAGPTKVQSMMVMDVNGDGPLDLFVGTEGDQRDLIYLGDAKGHFVERGKELGMEVKTSAMGSDAADIDGDGDPELFVSDYLPKGGGQLWVRQPDGRFVNEATARGLGELSQYSAWGVGLHDFDSDGDVDLLCVNAVPKDHTGIPLPQERLYFDNDGTGHFTRRVAPGSGLDLATEARGATFADFDDDGDIDVVVASTDVGPQHLRNDLPQGAWLKVALDYPWYRPAVGAVVTARAAGRTITRWVHGTPSFGGTSSLVVHLGLGAAETADELTVRWPHGEVQTTPGPLPARQLVTVRYSK
ncbi:MAG: CRTAC1 family protein [Myxococcales bacterium]|nr:CRTAC1 family protein [Myxococcales bacterium]